MTKQGQWFQLHWKWLVPMVFFILMLFVFFSSGMNKVTSDLTLAYSDTELYNKALEKVKVNEEAISILGELEPIDKLAIIEGQVNYSENNKVVKSSIRIMGSKGKAKLDLLANKVNSEWVFETITIRIKQPKDQQQTITILSEEELN